MDQAAFTSPAKQAEHCLELASRCANRAVADALSQLARQYLAAAGALKPDEIRALTSDDALSRR
jgi:hypothetical protein